MDVLLNKAQIAAYAMTQQIEPLVRGFLVVSLGPSSAMAMVGVDPDQTMTPERITSRDFGRVLGEKVLIVAFNDRSLVDAYEDLRVVHHELHYLDIVAVVVASGDYLIEDPEAGVQWIGDILESLPAAIRRPTELEAWATMRTRMFDPVDVAVDAGEIDDLEEQWLHAVVTGRTPERGLVARLASAVTNVETRDRLMLAAVRLGFTELDESSGESEVMSALLGSAGRPQGNRLVAAGLAAQFAASHVADGPSASQLYAISAMLLWGEGRARASLRAAEEALLHDRSNGFAASVEKLLQLRHYPTWFVA